MVIFMKEKWIEKGVERRINANMACLTRAYESVGRQRDHNDAYAKIIYFSKKSKK